MKDFELEMKKTVKKNIKRVIIETREMMEMSYNIQKELENFIKKNIN